MEGEYVRLTQGESPPATLHHLHFPALQGDFAEGAGADSDDEPILPRNTQLRGGGTWWNRLRGFQEQEQEPESAYLTLVPLSDSRLKPQHTSLIIGSLLLLAVVSAVTVFLLVPRGVTVGTIQVRSSSIQFNTSQSTYQILLQATIPVYNPNYLAISLRGTVNVSFYDQAAGSTRLVPVTVQARAQPQIITLVMDASSVPQKYLFTIYTQCFTFPEKLIFFLTGQLRAEYLGKSFSLPSIDNYFIISCNQPAKPDHAEPPPPGLPPALAEPPEPSSALQLAAAQGTAAAAAAAAPAAAKATGAGKTAHLSTASEVNHSNVTQHQAPGSKHARAALRRQRRA